MTIRLTIIGIDEISTPLSETTLGIVTNVTNRNLVIRKAFCTDGFNARRDQWNATAIIDAILEREKDTDEFVVVTSRDIYVPPYEFVIGYTGLHRKAGIVSTFRIQGTNLGERLAKEVIHEFGHTLGLGHCEDSSCVMRFSRTAAEIDRKSAQPCKNCQAVFAPRV